MNKQDIKILVETMANDYNEPLSDTASEEIAKVLSFVISMSEEGCNLKDMSKILDNRKEENKLIDDRQKKRKILFIIKDTFDYFISADIDSKIPNTDKFEMLYSVGILDKFTKDVVFLANIDKEIK